MKNISAKLVKVMSDCNYVQKEGKVEFGQTKYKYAQAAAVLEKVNDSLVKNNIACTCSPEIISFIDVINARGNIEHLATVRVNMTLIDSDSGEILQICGLGSGQDNGDKAVMKAQTAAIKYAWMLTLNISTGDDPEADQGVDERMTPQSTNDHQNKTTKQQTSKIDYADKKNQTNTNIPTTQQKPQQSTNTANTNDLATEAQLSAIQKIAKSKGIDISATDTSVFTMKQASDFIKELNSK